MELVIFQIQHYGGQSWCERITRNWEKESRMRLSVINSKFYLWESLIQIPENGKQKSMGIRCAEISFIGSFLASIINSCYQHYYLGLFLLGILRILFLIFQ